MKLPKPVLFLWCCVLIVGWTPAQTKKLRVVSSTAKIHIEAQSSSTVIGSVPKGTILTLFDSGSPDKSWYYISFYSEEKWATLTGFIAASQVEVMGGTPAPEPKEKRQVPPKKQVPAKRPPQKPAPTQSPEKKKTETVTASGKTGPAVQAKTVAEPEQAAELNPYSGEVKIVGEKPAVRASASAAARIMAVARFGEVLELTGAQGEWYRIKYPSADGIVLVGFLHLDQIEVLSSVALEDPELEQELTQMDKVAQAVERSEIKPIALLEIEKKQTKPSSKKNIEIPLLFESRTLSVGVHAGYGLPAETLYDGGFAYGAGISYLVLPHLGVELSVSRYQSDVEETDLGLSRGRLSKTPLMLSFQGRFPLGGRFVPYAVLGATLSLNSFKLCQMCQDNWDALGLSIDESIENSFGWHAGAGLDYQIARHMAINVDVRRQFLKGQGLWSLDDQLSDVSVSGDLVDLNLDAWIFRIGIKYCFRLFQGEK